MVLNFKNKFPTFSAHESILTIFFELALLFIICVRTYAQIIVVFLILKNGL
jgi:hypothetical protein